MSGYICRGCHKEITDRDSTVLLVVSPLDPSSTPHAVHDEHCAKEYYRTNGVSPVPPIRPEEGITLSDFEKRVLRHADSLE
jgi:hypothetical protein